MRVKVRGTPCGLVILNFSSASGLVQWLLIIIEIYNCCLYSHLYIFKSPSSFEHKDSYVDLTVSAKNLVLYVFTIYPCFTENCSGAEHVESSQEGCFICTTSLNNKGDLSLNAHIQTVSYLFYSHRL